MRRILTAQSIGLGMAALGMVIVVGRERDHSGTDRGDRVVGPYERLRVSGEKARNGSFDPSLAFNDDGSVGWLAYSAIEGPSESAGPYVHTRVAQTTDRGKSWRLVRTVNRSAESSIRMEDGSSLTGVWRYEVPSLVHDAGEIGLEWKLFSHKYFWNESRDRMVRYGGILVRSAADPAGDWSKGSLLLGAAQYAPSDPKTPFIRLNELDPSLLDDLVYTEPGALVKGPRLYLSLTAQTKKGPERIVLFASEDHARSWDYVGVLLVRDDAKALGYQSFDSSCLAMDKGKVFLMVSPAKKGISHAGTLIFGCADISKGRIERDGNGIPILYKRIDIDPAFPSSRGGGQSAYDRFDDYGGILISQFNLKAYPEVFQIFCTNEPLAGPPRDPGGLRP